MSNFDATIQMVEQAVEGYRSTQISSTLDNIKEIHDQVLPAAMKVKTCYIELSPMSNRAKLPTMFTLDFGAFIRNYVILQDPKRNQIRVAVERKKNKIYLTRGWSRLRDFYDLSLGGWLTILYMSPLLFYIRANKRAGYEVAYPERKPPHRFMLLKQSGDNDVSHGPVPYFLAPRVFYHTLEKTLTSSDVQSDCLVLYKEGFCKLALPANNCQVTLIDWLGHIWKCNYTIGESTSTTSTIYGQWQDLCKRHNLTRGITAKFGVTDISNNTYIHVKITPFIGVRTTLIAPTISSGQRALYQSDHFYML